MKTGWQRSILIAMVISVILMTVAGCKKSSAQRHSHHSSTAQKQVEKAADGDL